MNRAVARLVVASLIVATASCKTMMLNGVGVTTDEQDFDAMVGQDVRHAELSWGPADRTVVQSDSTSVYTWAESLEAIKQVDSLGLASRKVNQCVKSLTVSPAGKVVRWSANKACSKFRHH